MPWWPTMCRRIENVLSSLLADIGVEVTLAENGREALEKAQAGPTDIVFLDIRMPEMDGREAAQQIRRKLGNDAPKLVAISASALAHERQQYLEDGFDSFIDKPFRAERLFGCLAELLGVEYLHADSGAAAVDSDDLDLNGVSLPEDLYQRLKQATEISSVTEMEKTLDELEQQKPEAVQVATHMRELSQDFKMNEILGILERIDHG